MRFEQAGRRPGFWAWFLQRLSGAALVVLLLYHLWVQHLRHAGESITFSLEVRRFLSGLYQAVDVLLLAAVIFHGLNGVRNVAIDLGARGKGLWLVSCVLWAAGLVLLVWGLDALWPFVAGKPFFLTLNPPGV